MSDRPGVGVDRDKLVELVGELVGHESENPPGNEAGVAKALRERLEESPVDFEITTSEPIADRPNVVARAGDPSNGTVLLTGHTDVVPAKASEWSGDPYTLREIDGRLVGRGAVDMKGALAAKLLATEAYLTATGDPGEVVLGFVVDEEHGGRGTQAMVEEGIDADAAIIGEPTQLDVCCAQKGAARYRITVDGESAHSGMPDEGVDAIRAAGRLLAAFERFDEEVRTGRSHPLLEPETVTVTELAGGSAPNVVAGEATLTVDWRFLPGFATTPEPFDAEIERTIGTADLDPAISVQVDRTVFSRGAAIPADHELVETINAAAETLDIPSEPVGLNAATDARYLIHDGGIPTVLVGPGSLAADAHTVDESVAIDDLVSTTRLYRTVLEDLLG